MSMFTLYMLLKLDAVFTLFKVMNMIFITINIVWFFIFGIGYWITSDYYDNENEDSVCYKKIGQAKIKGRIEFTKKFAKVFIPIIIVCSLMTTFLPSTKEMAFIYVASKISNTEQGKNIGENMLNIPDNALEIVNIKMKEYLDDIKKETIKEVTK